LIRLSLSAAGLTKQKDILDMKYIGFGNGFLVITLCFKKNVFFEKLFSFFAVNQSHMN
jgi:hypothetical protein